MSEETAVADTPEVEAPVVEETPVSVDNHPPVEQPAAEQDSDPTDKADSVPAPGEDTPAKPKKGVQERINAITRAKHDEERKTAEAKAETEYWKAQVVQKPTVETTVQQAQGEPIAESFDSYEDYLRALAKHTVAEERQSADIERTQADQQAVFAGKQKAFMDKADSMPDLADDFVDVVYNPDLQVSAEMTEIAFESDIGPQLLYHLGKNPAESARIAAMSPAQAGRAIGQLEAKLTLPEAKIKTSAPAPIESISGGGETPQVDQDKMSIEQWMELRNATLAARGEH